MINVQKTARSGIFRPDLDIGSYANIFDLSNPGVARIRCAITPQHLELLRKEIVSFYEMGVLVDAPPSYGVATQKFAMAYLGSADNSNCTTLGGSRPLKELEAAYTNEIYNELAALSGFGPVQTMNSIGIHRYPADGGLLTYHQDSMNYLNLISVFTIAGRARFSIASSLQGDNSVSQIIEPGDLVLMRTLRNRTEYKTHRVYHAVASVGEDRYCIIFRHDSGVLGMKRG